MPDSRALDLNRMLNPRHVAVVGGEAAGFAAHQCTKFGFTGPVWTVNRNREYLGGMRCYPDIDDLPDPPDLVFIGVSRNETPSIVTRLRNRSAGGVICFSAGFAEIGAEGRFAQEKLAEAAGNMPMLGPNCYGLINCTRRMAMWPYFHGCDFTQKGAAFISQSGMLATSLTMNRRSLDFSYVISVGNQATLGAEDFIEALLNDPTVSAFALYIEGIRNETKFSEVASLALATEKPIVLLRVGTYGRAASITRHHTGMSAISAKYLDWLRDIGVIIVDSPSQLLETVKMVTHSVQPRGLRMAAFTCSGGDAAVLADCAEAYGIAFPQPTRSVARRLRELMPKIATVFNPLDCTTLLWGKAEIGEVFSTMLRDSYDVAVFVQDYPRPDIEFDARTDFREAKFFADAAMEAGIPAVICSSIAENLSAPVREHVLSVNAVPLQGVTEAMRAVVQACAYRGIRQKSANVASLR